MSSELKKNSSKIGFRTFYTKYFFLKDIVSFLCVAVLCVNIIFLLKSIKERGTYIALNLNLNFYLFLFHSQEIIIYIFIQEIICHSLELECEWIFSLK